MGATGSPLSEAHSQKHTPWMEWWTETPTPFKYILFFSQEAQSYLYHHISKFLFGILPVWNASVNFFFFKSTPLITTQGREAGSALRFGFFPGEKYMNMLLEG